MTSTRRIRDLTIAHEQFLSRLPVGWPTGLIGPKQQIRICPPQLFAPGSYRLEIDELALTATVTPAPEEASHEH